MSYQALARKWRPRFFSEVIGQEHVVSALSNALDQDRVHHAFLFTGTRGVGKTTLARIFAKALNCEQGVSSQPCGQCPACSSIEEGRFIDLLEVDAASRTKVDDTRELLDNVQYTPTQGRYKIYLIDEVHMLSGHSFNALLKTLEEPPEHVKFLLATTDPQKLPKTILSRCIQFNLKALDIGRIAQQMEKILEAEEIEQEPAALQLLARSANGSVRDGLSLLDQAIAFGGNTIREKDVRAMLGMIDDRLLVEIVDRLLADDAAGLLAVVSQMVERSIEVSVALDDLLSLLHNIALYQAAPEALEWKNIETNDIVRLAPLVDSETLQLFYQIGLIGKRDLALAPDPRTGFEMILLRMLAFQPVVTGSEKAEGKGGVMLPEANPRRQQAAGRTQTPLRSTDNPNPPETPPEPKKESSPQSSSGARVRFTLEQLVSEPEAWAWTIEHSSMGGIVKELAMNMAPVASNGTQLVVQLEPAHRRMCSTQRLRKIEQECGEILGSTIRLEVGEIPEKTAYEGRRETPAQRREREKLERLKKAQQNFAEDPNVREMAERFDADIVPESVTPPEQN